MKYTKTIEVEAKITAPTQLAISAFKKLQKYETKVLNLEQALRGWVSEIPKEEMQAYVDITQEFMK